MKKRQVELLWCTRSPVIRNGQGWTFPKTVRDLIVTENKGLSILHMFGGRADFGTRMDIDPFTRPDVVADAWMPPFRKGSFDVVILDPPYVGDFRNLNSQKLICLFLAAAWIARRRVIWFHPNWIDTKARVRFEKGWVVRVGRGCACRALQFFRVPAPSKKLKPPTHFQRGSAIRYNRWLAQPQGLPFGASA
jgi:hypothetical protein